MNESNASEVRKSFSVTEIENGFLLNLHSPEWGQFYAVDKEALLKRLNKYLEE